MELNHQGIKISNEADHYCPFTVKPPWGYNRNEHTVHEDHLIGLYLSDEGSDQVVWMNPVLIHIVISKGIKSLGN